MHSEYWIAKTLPIYRSKDLVFCQVLKNASYYFSTLVEKNGWTQIQFSEIDWNQDTVFSFIRHPAERYFKGLAEDAHGNPGLTHAIMEVLELEDKRSTLLIAHHSLPLSVTFGDYMYKMHWIPLDLNYTDGVNPDQAFVDLCTEHNVSIDWNVPGLDANKSDWQQLELYQTFKSKFTYNENFYKMFAKDIDLYNSVCSSLSKYYEPIKYTFL